MLIKAKRCPFCGSDRVDIKENILSYSIKESKTVPSVTPTRKVGKWIYDKTSQNWRCSECSETPKTIGYVGTSAFMTEHFKFCNHCGAEMEVRKNADSN